MIVFFLCSEENIWKLVEHLNEHNIANRNVEQELYVVFISNEARMVGGNLYCTSFKDELFLLELFQNIKGAYLETKKLLGRNSTRGLGKQN